MLSNFLLKSKNTNETISSSKMESYALTYK